MLLKGLLSIWPIRKISNKNVIKYCINKEQITNIHNTISSFVAKGQRLKSYGPVSVVGEKYMVNVIEKPLLFHKREVIGVIITNIHGNFITDVMLSANIIKTCAIAGLIMNSKNDYPINLEGSLLDIICFIEKNVNDIPKGNNKAEIEATTYCLNEKIEQLRIYAKELKKIFRDLRDCELPHYEMIAPFEILIKKIMMQYIAVINQSEHFFNIYHNCVAVSMLNVNKDLKNEKRNLLYQLSTIKTIVSHLSNWVIQEKEYVGFLMQKIITDGHKL